jgi:hypothetical protein
MHHSGSAIQSRPRASTATTALLQQQPRRASALLCANELGAALAAEASLYSSADAPAAVSRSSSASSSGGGGDPAANTLHVMQRSGSALRGVTPLRVRTTAPAHSAISSQITPRDRHAALASSPRAQRLGAELLVTSKRSSGAAAATDNTGSTSAHGLIEYFALCGVGASEHGTRHSLLYAVPTEPLADAVRTHLAEFCFPAGAPVHCEYADGRRPPARTVEDAEHSFGFALRTDSVEQPLYCACVLHEEPVRSAPACVPREHRASVARKPARRCEFTQRAYCLVSRYPFYPLLFALLYELVAIEHEHCARSDAPARHETHRRARAFMHMLDKLRQWQHVHPGELVRLERNSKCLRQPIEFAVPRQSDGGARVLLASQTVPALLTLLHVDTVLDALTALLVSQSLLVVGSHAGEVSACTTALLTLLHPFVWQYAAVPLLPAAYHEALYSPTPFAIGTVRAPTCASAGMARQYDCAVLDLDHALLALPDRLRTGDVPALPQRALLSAQLARHCDALLLSRTAAAAHTNSSPFARAQLADATAQLYYCVLEELAQYMMWLIHSIRRHLNTDNSAYASPDHIADAHHQRTLLARVTPAHQPFVRELLLSQHYQWMAEQFHSAGAPDSRVEGAYAAGAL